MLAIVLAFVYVYLIYMPYGSCVLGLVMWPDWEVAISVPLKLPKKVEIKYYTVADLPESIVIDASLAYV